MIAKIYSSCVLGIDAYEVTVETDVGAGLPAFNIVGLPDAAIKESRDRIKAAIRNSGYSFPTKKVTINLAPADIRKEGAAFDLPIALLVLLSEGVIEEPDLGEYIFCGELSLDGKLKPVKGALAIALGLRSMKKTKFVLPGQNAKEAAAVKDIEVYPAGTLKEVVDFLNKKTELKRQVSNSDQLLKRTSKFKIDFSDVRGQEHVKRGLEVAAAGAHNVLSMGTQYDRRAGKRTDYVPNVIGRWTQICVHTVLAS